MINGHQPCAVCVAFRVRAIECEAGLQTSSTTQRIRVMSRWGCPPLGVSFFGGRSPQSPRPVRVGAAGFRLSTWICGQAAIRVDFGKLTLSFCCVGRLSGAWRRCEMEISRSEKLLVGEPVCKGVVSFFSASYMSLAAFKTWPSTCPKPARAIQVRWPLCRAGPL